MRRLIHAFILGIFLLAILPVAGSEMSIRNHGNSVAVAGGGGSIHYKNSSWPVVVPHRVASGSANLAGIAI